MVDTAPRIQSWADFKRHYEEGTVAHVESARTAARRAAAAVTEQ